MDNDAARTLHEWLFALVEELCHDREYLYRSFVENFGGFMTSVYREGCTTPAGEFRIPGIKSGRYSVVRWALDHRVDYSGPNLLSIEATVSGAGGGTEKKTARFDLSTGEAVGPG
jgi:hypothetical protein